MENPYEIIMIKLNRIEEAVNCLSEAVINGRINNKRKPVLVRIHDAAAITGYSKSYIYTLVSKKDIPHIKKGKLLLFDPDKLEKWMNV